MSEPKTTPEDKTLHQTGPNAPQEGRCGSTIDLGVCHSLPGAPTAAADGNRFIDLKPHAVGGLGEVMRAVDVELNRDVAVKRLQPRYAAQAESRRRFLAEAEVTARLEHPGIVPVYGLAPDENGRPGYAMRFIQGVTLFDALRRHHQEAPDDPVSFRRLLAAFVDVCNAVAYAHSHGIVHRDLKPQNVMLGPFGETLVVDWGLAKSVQRQDVGDDSQEGPASSGSGDDTAPGSAVGTPGFMSPEQAAGRRDEVGVASDVYGLGATLYSLLVGRSPITGESWTELKRRILEGDFPRPRAGNPRAPAALEAVCLKAMARTPGDRYPSALDLAADIERWLAGQPVSAYPEPVAARLRRWARKHRTAVTSAAAVLLVGSALLAGASVMLARAYQNEKLARVEEGKQRVAAEEARTLAEQSRSQAEEARTQTLAMVNQFVAAFRSPDPARDGRTVTVAEVLDRAVERLDRQSDDNLKTRIRVLDAIAQTYRSLGLRAKSVEVFERVRTLTHKAFGDASATASTADNNLALAYQDAGRLKDAIPLFAASAKREEVRRGRDDPTTLTMLNNLAIAHREAGRMPDALAIHREVLERRRASLGPDDPLTLIALNGLGLACTEGGHAAEGVALLEEAVRRGKAKLGDDHPDTLVWMNNLGLAYQAAGRLTDAVRLFEETLTKRRAKLGPDHPNTWTSAYNLAAAYRAAGRPAQALPLLEEILAKRRQTLGLDHHETIAAMGALAQVYHALQRLSDALPLYEDSLARARKQLGAGDPDVLLRENNLGVAYREAKRLDEALTLQERAYRGLWAKLGPNHPNALPVAEELGKTYRAAQRHLQAGEAFEEAVRLATAKFGNKHRKTLENRNAAASSWLRANRPEHAEPHANALLDARRRRPEEETALADALALAGICRLKRNDFAKAESLLRECLVLRERRPATWAVPLTKSLLGGALVGSKKFGEAEPYLVAGYEGLSAARQSMPASARFNVDESLDRLLRLYDAWGKPDLVAAWRQKSESTSR